MLSDKAQFAMIGTAVMGRNLALNILDQGYRVAAYNREPDLLERAVVESGGRLRAAGSLEELTAGLERPRRIMMMIKAGGPVDHVMAQDHGIPVPGMATGLAYLDSYRSAELPQNLTQAQRDAFGAHTYQRKEDPDGPFVHGEWLK